MTHLRANLLNSNLSWFLKLNDYGNLLEDKISTRWNLRNLVIDITDDYSFPKSVRRRWSSFYEMFCSGDLEYNSWVFFSYSY